MLPHTLVLTLTLTLCSAAAFPLLLPRQRLLERERPDFVDSDPGLSSESEAFPDEAFLGAGNAEQPSRGLAEALVPRSSLAEALGPQQGLGEVLGRHRSVGEILAGQRSLEEALGDRLGLGKAATPVELWRSLLLMEQREPWRGAAKHDTWAGEMPPVAFNPNVAPSHRVRGAGRTGVRLIHGPPLKRACFWKYCV